MLISKIVADGNAEYLQIEKMKSRAASENARIAETAASMLAEIRAEGTEAVNRYSMQLDHALPREISRRKLEEAYRTCDPKLVSVMKQSAENIRAYQSHLLHKSDEWEVPGGKLGQIVRPLERVGVYVPGGTAAYPSSVLMNVIPAKVAGVQEVVMVTPPTEHLNQSVLAAALIAGVDRVFAIGGVQAVGALAYGVSPLPKVDKLVGPGNAYVAAAKRLCYGQFDIDMIAGPSEVLVIADGKADPSYIAADVLSQAEHDVLASAILLTDDNDFADRVIAEIERQTTLLSRKEIIQKSLNNYGAVIVCSNLWECAALANQIAPEHLEIVTENPRDLLPEIRNAGAVFLGQYTPEPLGDYMAGPSHVLPTSGTARFFSPLSAESFLKRMSLLEYTREGLESVEEQIRLFAHTEGLTAHANSIEIRFGRKS